MSGELSVAAASLNALPVSLVQIVAQPDCEFVYLPRIEARKNPPAVGTNQGTELVSDRSERAQPLPRCLLSPSFRVSR